MTRPHFSQKPDIVLVNGDILTAVAGDVEEENS